MNLTVTSRLLPGQRGRHGTILIGKEELSADQAMKLAEDIIMEVIKLSEVELAQIRGSAYASERTEC